VLIDRYSFSDVSRWILFVLLSVLKYSNSMSEGHEDAVMEKRMQ
jgi:hypothetical protein